MTTCYDTIYEKEESPLSIDFKSPAGRDLSMKTLKIVGYFMLVFGILGFGQSLFFEKEKSALGITGTLFLAMLGLYQIFSSSEIFKNRKIALINLLTLIFIDAFLYSLATINLAGGIFALPLVLALYAPTFVLVRDYRQIPKNKIKLAQKLKITQYLYLTSLVIVIISIFIDTISSQFK